MVSAMSGLLDENKTVDFENKKVSLSRLQSYYSDASSETVLNAAINNEFKGKIALFSSFGTESALLISKVAEVDNELPVLFLDTEKHFKETYEYVKQLEKKFNLKNLQYIKPKPDMAQRIDPKGELWKFTPNRCCWLRKVEPLQRYINETDIQAIITGRKRHQTEQRSNLEHFQVDEDGVFRVNPLALWDKNMINAEFEKLNLPRHPLYDKGYKSIGCQPCTVPIKDGQDERDGRWSHTMNLYGDKKTECGIHLPNADNGEFNI